MALLDFLNFTWLRNLLGIRKDLIDTKKSQLEVRKLKDEELARNLITPATLDDVKKYDPKTGRLLSKIEDSVSKLKNIEVAPKPHWLARLLDITFLIMLFLGLIKLLYDFIIWIYKMVFI